MEPLFLPGTALCVCSQSSTVKGEAPFRSHNEMQPDCILFCFFLSPVIYLIPLLYVSCVWYEGLQIKLQSKQARARKRWGVCGSTALEVVCENPALSRRNVGAVSSFLSRVFHSEDETVSRPVVWFLLLGGEGQSDWHYNQECLTLSPCGNVRLKALIQVRWGLKLG